MDVLTQAQRRLNMSRIRDRDTRPEMIIRRGLHGTGFRYRLHVKALPGRPDLVFPAKRAVILVNGCFWHGHDCSLFRLPATRADFWQAKIAANRARDARTETALLSAGWRVLTVWECSLKGRRRKGAGEVVWICAKFLNGSDRQGSVRENASMPALKNPAS